MSSSNDSTAASSIINPPRAKCRVFDGNTCFEWLNFLTEWKAFMNHLGVSEIILKGTHYGGTFGANESKYPQPKLEEILVAHIHSKSAQNAAILKPEFYKLLREDHNWLPYYLKNRAVPVGRNNGVAEIRVPFHNADFNESEEAQVRIAPYGHAIFVGPQALILGDATSPLINNLDMLELAGAIATLQSHGANWVDSMQHLNDILAGDPDDPDDLFPPMTVDEYIRQSLSPIESRDVYAQLRTAVSLHLQITSKLGELERNCHACFDKISGSKRDQVEPDLRVHNFHQAFKGLNAYYVRLGAGNVKAFEDEVEAYELQPGQDLHSHLEAVTQAMKRWANVQYLQNCLHAERDNDEASVPLIDIPESVGILNSGDSTDAEIRNWTNPKVPVVISELRRFEIIRHSVAKSSRFKNLADTFSSFNEREKTVKSLLQKLRNQEISNAGQLALKDERKANPNWQKKLVEYLEEIKGSGMHSHSKASANVAVADVVPSGAGNKRKRANGNSSSSSTSTTKHCINHPNSNSHDTSECRISAATTPSANKKAKTSDGKGKAKYTGPPCSWCLTQPKYRDRAAPTHSVDQCKLKGKGQQSANNAVAVPDPWQAITRLTDVVSRLESAISQTGHQSD